MSYTVYIPNTMLNITGIFIFSTIMLFYISGNDMIKIQQKTIDDAINDFRLILGLTNFNFSDDMKDKIIAKLIEKNKESDRIRNNKSLFKKAVYVSLILILTTITSFLFFGRELKLSYILFNLMLISSLFITEVYIYYEIIRMYKYKTKEVFYNRLFYLLLGDNDVKLKNKICKPYIDEEQVI